VQANESTFTVWKQSQCCMLRAIFTFHSCLPSLQLLSMDYDQADPSLVSHLIPRKYCISCNILGAFMGGSAKHWSSWLTVGAPLNPLIASHPLTSWPETPWNITMITMKPINPSVLDPLGSPGLVFSAPDCFLPLRHDHFAQRPFTVLQRLS